MIAEFRSSRIRNFKLVYPVVSSTVSSKTPKADLRPTSLRNRGRVSEAVAPATMFQKNRGSTNSDLIEQVKSYIIYLSFLCVLNIIRQQGSSVNMPIVLVMELLRRLIYVLTCDC